MKLCPGCKLREPGKSGKCKECQKKVNDQWYEKNKDHHKNKILNRLKETNYRAEKTPAQRVIRRLKERTRRNFPITKDTLCQICETQATERHHNTNPIQYDKFIFVCHNCHIDLERMKGGVRR